MNHTWGEVFFTDIPNNRIHKVSLDGKVAMFAENTGGANGLMFGPDGKLYARAATVMRAEKPACLAGRAGRNPASSPKIDSVEAPGIGRG